MNRLVFVLVGMFIGWSSWAQNAVINDPNAQMRYARNFHGIEVSNAIDLYLSQGDSEAVAVSAKDIKYRDRIVTTVENGVLKIKIDREGWKWMDGNKKLKAYVSFKTLNSLGASGASDVYVDGLMGPFDSSFIRGQ
jgi:hypothetical protein